MQLDNLLNCNIPISENYDVIKKNIFPEKSDHKKMTSFFCFDFLIIFNYFLFFLNFN